MMYEIRSRTHTQDELIALGMVLSKKGVIRVLSSKTRVYLNLDETKKQDILDALSAQGVWVIEGN